MIKCDMDSNSGKEWPNPKRLKTLASNVKYAEGNNLLHQFVLNNSPPHQSHSESYLNAHLLTISSTSLYVNALNAEGYSPLHLAVLKNNLLMVKKLLFCLAKIDVNRRCNIYEDENTALHLAAKSGHLDITQALLDQEASVDVANLHGNTPLCFAAQSGHLGIVKLLVRKGANVNLMGCYNFPLHCAAESGNLESVTFLLSNGADLSSEDSYGGTVLHCATKLGNFAITEFLVSNGADVNAKNRYGKTPLCYAAEVGHLGTVKFLLDKGADLNIKSESGTGVNAEAEIDHTPLSDAVFAGNLAVVEFLVRKGANVNAKVTHNRTPLHDAVYRKHLEIFKFLLNNGADADLNAKDKSGRTPLHLAVMFTVSIRLTKMLIERGADVNATDKEGKAPLHHLLDSIEHRMRRYSSCGDRYEIACDRDKYFMLIKLLLEGNADVNIKDKREETPFCRAMRSKSCELIKLFSRSATKLKSIKD